MSHLAEGYPWCREISFAMKLAHKNRVASGFFRRDQSWWQDVRNELALKLLSIEPYRPNITRSKWKTIGSIDAYVVQVCRNYLVDLSRHAINPLDLAKSISKVNEESGDLTETEIPDKPELVPDSKTNLRRVVFLQAL